MPTIKKRDLRIIAISLGAPESSVLHTLRATVDAIAELAPQNQGIAEKRALLQLLEERGALHPDVMLRWLEKAGTVTWCYGCIEGWRLNP